MRELVIDSIRISQMNYQRVVVLKELETNLFLLIWIGPTEAEAIAVKMQGMTVPRPLTHDLLVDLVKSVGGSFEHILVNDPGERNLLRQGGYPSRRPDPRN